jgi:glycosyltransferase involved in cell wall biosynthesis
MRILTFIHSFEPGGVERIALRLVRQWRADGIDAPLFVGRTDGSMRHDVGAGLDFMTPGTKRNGGACWEALWMILTLPRIVRQQKPDVLFCAGNTYAIVAVAMKILLGWNCPPVIAKISNDLQRRDKPWWRRLPYHLFLRIQGRLFDHVVGMDASMTDEIRRLMAVPRNAITVIPDPALSRSMIARLRAQAPEMCPASARRFVAVGRLAPQKNIALMLRAFARAAGPNDRLTLIGDGSERAKLERLALRLGIADRIHFLGYVAEPTSILCDFDILLLSSNYEGVPAVILEALAAKLSIVATDCCASMAALLHGGELGDLVPVRDEAALARAISRARPGRQNGPLSLALAEGFTLERASEQYLATMAGLRPAQRGRRIFHENAREGAAVR